MSMTQVQFIIRLKNDILKYGSDNLIIFYCCAYSKLLNIIRAIIESFTELMRSIGFSL